MTRTSVLAALALTASVASLGIGVADDPVRAQDRSVIRPITAVDCVTLAERQTGLTPTQTRQLCIGAPNPRGPVDCYLGAVRQLNLTDDQAVLLCRCTDSTEPVTCWQHARAQGRLIDPEIEQLCSPTLALGLLPNCRYAGY
jgi:hypothetical protein